MPGLRAVLTIGLIFLFIQSLTYIAYRNHQPPSSEDGPLLQVSEVKAPGAVSPSTPLTPSVPLVPPAAIRRKLWQTSKHAPMALDAEYQDNIKRWDEMNPSWRHEVLTDKGSDEYVRDRFSHDSEVVSVYTGLTDNIMRADFFRYLVLLGDGGVYTDIDTQILKPIEQWIPDEYMNQTSAVVGIEYDTFGLGHGEALLDLQLVNWTIMSKANHRLMEIVVKNCVKSIKALAKKQNVGIEAIKATFNDVLASTGPTQLTRSTWQYLTEVTGEEFTWQKVTGLGAPMLAHDILILPVTSFANGQTHSNSRPPTDPSALVHHQFKGTWKTGSHAFKEMKHSEKNNW